MSRRRLTPAEKTTILHRQNHQCGCRCGAVLLEAVEYDHIIPLGLGGKDTINNMQALVPGHHRIKTAGDLATIAKAKRQEKKLSTHDAAAAIRAAHDEKQARKRKIARRRPGRRQLRRKINGKVEPYDGPAKMG